MKIEVDRKGLTAALQLCTRIAGKSRATVTVEPTDIGISLSAAGTDSEVEARLDAEREGVSESFAVPLKLFSSVVGQVTGDSVQLDHAEGEVRVKSGRSRYKVRTLPAPEPLQMYADDWDSFWVPSERDSDHLCRVATLVGDKGASVGVSMEPAVEGLAMVATDGYMLGVARSEFPQTAERLVPASVVELAKFSEGPLSLRFSSTTVHYATPMADIWSRLIAIPYPRWDHLLDRDFGLSIEIDRDDLRDAVRRAEVVIDGDYLAKRFILASIGSICVISGTGADGTSAEEIDCEGDRMRFNFLSTQMLKLLGAFPSGRLTLAQPEPVEGKKNADKVVRVTHVDDPAFAAYLVLLQE